MENHETVSQLLSRLSELIVSKLLKNTIHFNLFNIKYYKYYAAISVYFYSINII